MPRGRKPKATTIDELKAEVKTAEKNYEKAKDALKEAQKRLSNAQKEQELEQKAELFDTIQMWAEEKNIDEELPALIDWFKDDAYKIHAKNHPEEEEE